MLRRLCTAIATTMFSSHSAMFMFQTKSKASRRWTANSLTAGPGLWRELCPRRKASLKWDGVCRSLSSCVSSIVALRKGWSLAGGKWRKDFPRWPEHNSFRERGSARVRSQPRTRRDRTQPPSRRSASAGRHHRSRYTQRRRRNGPDARRVQVRGCQMAAGRRHPHFDEWRKESCEIRDSGILGRWCGDGRPARPSRAQLASLRGRSNVRFVRRS